MKSCPHCGVSVQVEAQFCGQCGHNFVPTSVHSESSAGEEEPELSVLLPPQPQLSAEDSLTYVLPLPSFAESSETRKRLENRTEPGSTAPQITQNQGGDDTAHSPFATKIQMQAARLVHVQSNTFIELPQHLSLLHIGKPNAEIPPDIDIAGFPHSEVVSRVHADIHIESGHFFIEDVDSANGTYINSIPLRPRHQHQLRSGDRIALGKGDLVTFLFQMD